MNINTNNILLDLKSVKRDILKGIYECTNRGLFQAQKWLSELNYALDHVELLAEEENSEIIRENENYDKENASFLLGKSYFNIKEYDRCAHFLRNSKKPKSKFLHYYARFLSIEKKKLDNMCDTNCPPDPTQNDALKTLCSELERIFYENKLDGYCTYLYGIILNKLEMKSLALNVFIKSIQDEPILWNSWYELGKLLNEQNKNLLDKLPEHWMKHFFTAHANLEQLNNNEALEIYQNLSDIGFENSSYVMSQIALGYHNNRKLLEAIDMFKKILEFDPYRLDNLDTYSNLLYVYENKKELAVLAATVVNIDKYRVETCCVVGNYYSLRSDHAKAVLYFKRALKLNPHFLSAWTLIGHEYMELKNINAAIQSYRKAIEINRRDYRAWYGLGQTYEILKMPYYSLNYYKQAQMLKPNDSRMIIALGETYEKLDQSENALKCYYKACKFGDVEGSALIKLAKLYDKLNDIDNAVAVFTEYCLREDEKKEKIAEEQPDYYSALQYLAKYYIKKGNLDDGYMYAFKCIECEETKEQGKALLKAIAAKRIEQDEEERFLNADRDMDYSKNNDTSNMDLTFGD